MEKLFSRRHIWVGLISLLLLWSAIFLFVQYVTPKTPVLIAWDNLRSRLGSLTPHNVVHRKNRLQSWDTKKHTLTSSRTFHIPWWIEQPWIAQRIPASSWTIFVEGITQYAKSVWSWTYAFTVQVNVFSGENTQSSWNNLDTIPETINLSWSLSLLRSWQAVRWQLHNLSISQESWINTFILVSRAYVKQFENTRIYADSISPSRIDLIQGNLFDRLAAQSKQHLIPSSSGEVKLIIEGDQEFLDMTISTDTLLNWTMSLNKNKHTLTISEDADSGKLETTIYWKNDKEPLWAWYIWLDVSSQKLVLTSNRSWNLKETVYYSGTHSSSFTQTDPFPFILPEKRRPWWEIK